jgi:hypothetical protein
MNATLFRTGVPLLDGLADAPNPKPTRLDKRQFGALASLYTAFSKEFAGFALHLFQQEGFKVIADPFSGMGTVGEAGRSLAIELHLSDISPFATLSGAFRSATQSAILSAAARVEELAPEIIADDERVFFEHLFRAVGAGSQIATELALKAPSEPEHNQTALAVYLAAVSRIRLHKRFAGSNPTWIKRPSRTANLDATRCALAETLSAARNFANDLENLDSGNRTSIRWSSILNLPTEPNSLDAIITSPPYANRTDYIGHYLPASEMLLAAAGRSEREARLEQIGTPLIRVNDPTVSLPSTVQDTIDRIRHHASYASERYYYKGFLYYFSDMKQSIQRLGDWLRPGGLILMVVQDAFYKEIHVATPDLICDLAEASGLKTVGRKNWNVRQYLSQLSPHSRKTVRPHQRTESVIAFSK